MLREKLIKTGWKIKKNVGWNESVQWSIPYNPTPATSAWENVGERAELNKMYNHLSENLKINTWQPLCSVEIHTYLDRNNHNLSGLYYTNNMWQSTVANN